MKALDDDQVSVIAEAVARAGIGMEELRIELTDHLCCATEQLMNEGKSFDDAWAAIQSEIHTSQLRTVEEQTRIATDIQFATMNNTMKITGVISLSLISAGTLMRILHLTGANIVLVTGALLLVVLFLPAALLIGTDRMTSAQRWNRYLLIAGGDLLIAGVLGKVLHWNGSTMFLVVGLLILILQALGGILPNIMRSANDSKTRLTYATGLFAIILISSGTVFKIAHWPGTSALLILGSFLLSAVFFPAYITLRKSSEKNILPVILFLSVFCIYIISMTTLVSMNKTSTIDPTEIVR